MMKNKVYTVTLIGIIIDQVSKMLIKSNMELFSKIVIIPKFFSLYYVKNKGAAFSIFGNMPCLLTIMCFVVFLLLIYYIEKEEKNLDLISSISFGMILSGIIGNLIDRILYGSVVDFLSFKIFSYNFPIFNMADTFIVCGVILYIINVIICEKGGAYDSRKRKFKRKN